MCSKGFGCTELLTNDSTICSQRGGTTTVGGDPVYLLQREMSPVDASTPPAIGYFECEGALAPREDERANAALTVVCPTLEAVVSVLWQDVIRVGAARSFTCVCGGTETVAD